MYKRLFFFLLIPFIIVIGYFTLASGTLDRGSFEGLIIFTRVPVEEDSVLQNKNVKPDYKNARIVSISRGDPESTLKVLTEGFYSACSPVLSFDNKKLLFTAKLTRDDPWQIWSMASDLKALPVTHTDNDCFNPALLPNGKILFSSSWKSDRLGEGSTLFTCNSDGSENMPITFHPHADYSSSILHDGRILTLSNQIFPESKNPEMLVLRPDGTKCELFYNGTVRSYPKSKAWEDSKRNIFFIESNTGSQSDELVVIRYANPWASKEVLISDDLNNLHSVYPDNSGKLIISARLQKAKNFSLLEWESKIRNVIYKDQRYHAIEPIFAGQRDMPKNLPSIVNEEAETGLLICMNANQFRPENNRANQQSKTLRIRVSGINSMLGEVPLEEDGSFYLEVKADMPIRFESLNDKRELISKPSSWIWLRPNERRGCIGCHQRNEITPENTVPKAINNPPLLITDSVSTDVIAHFLRKKKGGTNEK